VSSDLEVYEGREYLFNAGGIHDRLRINASPRRLAARIEGLEAVVAMAIEWQDTWEAECIAKNRTESERIDLTLAAQLDQARELARTERFKALAPYIAASLLGLAFLRSRS
jgi:hypothetical protein